MMLKKAVEIVRRATEANRSGPPAETVERAAKLAHPDLEFVSHLAAVEGRTYRGVDGVRAYFDDLTTVWREWHNEVRSATEVAPDTIVVENVFRGIGKSGVEVENTSALVWTLLDGGVVRLHSYSTLSEALAAVGLSD